MNKISVSIKKECAVFSKCNEEIAKDNLNNTNVINVKKLKFTEEYIKQNLDIISSFFNLILLKFKVNRVIIKDNEISEIVLLIINDLKNINEIEFEEDKELTYTICSILAENKNLESIYCYNIPNIMFYKFDDGLVKTRNSIAFISSFFEYNNIKTYSDIYNKKTINIPQFFDSKSVEDLIYFFETNKNIKKIEFKKYNKMNLETITKTVYKNCLKNVTIIIDEDENTTKNILNDIKFFDELSKKYSVNIKIKYSKKYKEQNKIKAINLNLLKTIIIVIITGLLLILLAFKLFEDKSLKGINKNIDEIDKIVDNIDDVNTSIDNSNENSNYVSPYYKDYSSIYEDLLEINSDTVGWLSVNNTKVNYPVVQTDNNDYYLNHAYDRTKNIAGWVFVDYANDMDNLSQNTIIYGHSMLKGNHIFSSLTNVLKSDWYNNEENLNIKFSIKGKNINWKIFSIYTIEKTNDYIYTSFPTEKKYIEFINKIKSRSIKDFNQNVSSNSKVLTLSTCYKDDSKRIVIHAFSNFF